MSVTVALVVEGDRLERQNGFAGFVHRFNLFLEPPRGAQRPQLACRNLLLALGAAALRV